jgi:superfamily II DNA or RNA helicase
MIQPISISTARALLDFSGGSSSADIAAEQQLEGAVALHNLLTQKPFVYLADEVGMGKTYVALGTVALFRHFHPAWRVLYLTPRENIQQKWLKELQNFTANNWRVTDNRVRSFQGTPAYGVSVCHSLLDFAREAALNPARDFILRLTSFSFGLGDDAQQWRGKREELLDVIPWLSRSAFNLRDKEEFKTNFACALNAIIPHFDLVVVDECHNLKHGFQAAGGASRNRLLGYFLGAHDALKHFQHYEKRFDRVLALSATPLESDYRELWHQQDMFDCGDPILINAEIDDSEKKKAVEGFLVRRLTKLTINGDIHTKNMYRREWRKGGVSVHDEPLQMADDQQKLIVALVQKKVAEILGNEQFNHSFQIGMLASFESFLETAGVKSKDNDGGVFDDSDQTDQDIEREGIDTNSINHLAKSYRQRFGKSLPHPKMDAVAESLRTSFETGQKSLIFVRRVKSISELTEKLNRHYDNWLKSYLLKYLKPQMYTELAKVFERYENERRVEENRLPKGLLSGSESDEEATKIRIRLFADAEDEGANENFFAWFFRGEGPKGIFSGTAFNRNRLTSEGSAYATFFEDNYVLALLGETSDPIATIAEQIPLTRERILYQLRFDAYCLFRADSHQQKFPRLRVFWAYQEAALRLLADHAHNAEVREHARIMVRERFGGEPIKLVSLQHDFPKPEESLLQRTFFTELVKQPTLHAALWPEESFGGDFTRQFRRREQRRELLVAAARLGHPLVDLWLLAANRLGSLSGGVQERSEYRAEDLIDDYVNLLEQQSRTPNQYTAFYELNQIAQHFDLLLAVNFPTATQEPLKLLPRLFGRALARQTPVAGMSGGVNKSLVQQFRMPGYPLLLVTTDVLQEGEDLHTFCSQVIHYGIAWTPSALEQRTGRVDRIRSLTSRRLQQSQVVAPEDFLQVFYPHLYETVERLQVERVYDRMNRFIRLMHRQLICDVTENSYVNTQNDMIIRPLANDIAPIRERLETPFDVKPQWLCSNLPLVSTGAAREASEILKLFQHMTESLSETFELIPEPSQHPWSYFVTIFLDQDGAPNPRGKGRERLRYQPLTLFLKTSTSDQHVLLRCVSPIGKVAWDDSDEIEQIAMIHQGIGHGKICALADAKKQTYDLTIEMDMLFHPNTTQFDEVINLVERTASSADQIEQALLNVDQKMDMFRADLFKEPRRG